MKCASCGQPIRETEPRDGIEAHDGEYEFRYVHEDGNPVCDGMFQASPGGAGYGPAPVAGYLAGGKFYHPDDVTIIREGQDAS
jgi:hypothetical protein